MSSIVRPKSLTELVTEKLTEDIISGKLKLGSQISEVKIAKEFNVSRTPVREAINRLEMEGLVTVEPQRGTFVFCLEPDELAQLCDARTCLESAALISAIQNNPKDFSNSIRECTNKMTSARNEQNDTEYLILDSKFHQLFFDHSGNRFLNDAYQTISQKMSTVRNMLGRHPDHMSKSYKEHLEILTAIEEKNEEKALKILHLHIDRKEGEYWSAETKKSI
ncbi:GntR family transcriptional regulator [Marinomonas sp. S3726]|uniref:GntR family transcriptional regulator n=1 Tax=Marinomonas sp. S3726 TaxID=579484 RepID=UPI0005FA9226|nr:GntR family transcriptional regulator [Marinomonas sp. S3726]